MSVWDCILNINSPPLWELICKGAPWGVWNSFIWKLVFTNSISSVALKSFSASSKYSRIFSQKSVFEYTSESLASLYADVNAHLDCFSKYSSIFLKDPDNNKLLEKQESEIKKTCLHFKLSMKLTICWLLIEWV